MPAAVIIYLQDTTSYIMKKHFRLYTAILTLVLFTAINTVSMAQPPPPPPDGHGLSGNKSPREANGAPIGEGLFLLIGLAGLYGGKKIYDMRKAVNSE